MTDASARVVVVVPCYKVTDHVLGVLDAIGPEVARIYCIDDACPDHSGDLIERECHDPRVTVLRHEVNQGVGGAVLAGYQAALTEGADIIVKVDGDGQMDPALIPMLIMPILDGGADYTKGNRFYHLNDIRGMPALRIFGNASLSFLTKLSTGYWNLFDPTNGFTAIHAHAASLLRFEQIAKRFFFESDMLFHLGLEKAVVIDVPIRAHYGTEVSNLKITQIFFPYLSRHFSNTVKRIFYNYYIRDFSIASLEIILGITSLLFGVVYGLTSWATAIHTEHPSAAGTVMLAALPTIVGIQMLFNAINFDIQNVPSYPLQRLVFKRNKARLTKASSIISGEKAPRSGHDESA